MDFRVIGVTIGILYVFCWFAPLSYVNIGDAFGAFFGAFDTGRNTQMSNLSNDMTTLSREMFGDTYTVISGENIGGFTWLMLIAGGAFAYFAWMKNHSLLVVTAAVMAGLAVLVHLNYISDGAWGYYLLLLTTLSACVYCFTCKREAPDFPV